jgi:hypothetical protein
MERKKISEGKTVRADAAIKLTCYSTDQSTVESEEATPQTPQGLRSAHFQSGLEGDSGARVPNLPSRLKEFSARPSCSHWLFFVHTA